MLETFNDGVTRYWIDYPTATTAGASTSTAVRGSVMNTQQLTVVGVVTTTAYAEVQLEGSLDDTNWFGIATVATLTSNGTTFKSAAEAMRYIRNNILTITGMSIQITNMGIH